MRIEKLSSSGRRLRVLVMTSTFPRWVGDNEPAFIYTLCERLSQQFEVWVLAPHAPGAQIQESLGRGFFVKRFRYCLERAETLAYQGGILAKLRSNRFRYLLVVPFVVAQWFAVVRLQKTHKFDIVHAHWLIPQGFVAVLAKCLFPSFPKLVCTSHGSDLHGLQGGLFARIKRFTVSQSDAYTVVSEAMRQSALAQHIDVRNIQVIPMGVDADCLFTPGDPAAKKSMQLLLFHLDK